jgi:hypothetical protein
MKRSGKVFSIKRNNKASITILARHFYNFYNLFLTLYSSLSTLLCLRKSLKRLITTSFLNSLMTSITEIIVTTPTYQVIAVSGKEVVLGLII